MLARPFRVLSREPMVVFFLVAVCLFAVNAFISPEEFAGGADRTIAVGPGKVVQLAESYQLLTGSLPSADELRNLIADFIDEEIAYREAVAMGLDRDDTVIRRRLRQKFEFVTLDTALIEPPTDERLRRWLKENAERYRVPERRALRVITFLDDAGRTMQRAAHARERLLKGTAPGQLGDQTLLPRDLPLTTRTGVERHFGTATAAAAFAAPNGEWVGPVASHYGAHLVLVEEVAAARSPSFQELRPLLLEDWVRAREAAELERAWRQLRSRYEVEVKLPDTGGPPAQRLQLSATE